MYDLPDPFVSAYKVGELAYKVDTFGKISIEWKPGNTTDQDGNRTPWRIVNTIEIEQVLQRPNTFLVGWQETHYQAKPSKVGDQIIQRAEEVIVNKRHSVNEALIQMIQNAEFTGKGAHIRSFEHILFQFGWRFEWRAVGNEDIIGAVTSAELMEKAENEPEIKALRRLFDGEPLEKQTISTVSASDLPKHSTLETHKAPSSTDTRINAIELKVSELTAAVTQLVGALSSANHNDVGTSESRPVDDERKEVGGDFIDEDRGPTEPSSVELGSPGNVPAGSDVLERVHGDAYTRDGKKLVRDNAGNN